ncbi:MAG TPA: heme-binding protein [Methyloceanibacter sp.]
MSRKWIHLAVGLFVLAAYDPANSASLVSSQKLPWATAEKLASEAVRICEERGYSVAAAVVDPSGIQQVVIRGDAAPVHTLSVAYRKAYTAFFFGRNYNENTIGELIAGKLTGPENGALNTVPEVLFVPGGVVLRTSDNTAIGGLGVSGAPGGDKDEACATDAAAKLQDELQ